MLQHCDTKADNWVLSPSDIDGERINASDVMLTDFGRAIDLEALESGLSNPLDVQLKGKASRNDMMCVAMRKDLPWSFDIDTYGLCDTAHILLFGCNMQIVRNPKTGKWGPKEVFRRYHKIALWSKLFEELLNLQETSMIALGSRPGFLKELRVLFEEHLETNSADLKLRLKRQASVLPRDRLNGTP